MICGLARGVDDATVEADSVADDSAVGFVTTDVFGVLNAPVEAFWSRSNSSCSLGGKRGGAGPVANAGRRLLCEKHRREGTINLRASNRDIALGY